MKLDLRTALHHPAHYVGTITADVEEVKTPVEFEGTLKKDTAAYVLDGTLSIVYNLVCARCLKPFSRCEKVGVHVFLRKLTHDAHQADTEEDEEILYYENEEEVDMTDYLRGEVLLGVPSKAVCSESCKGICPICGEDRDSGICTCKDEHIDAKWAKLTEIKRELYGGD